MQSRRIADLEVAPIGFGAMLLSIFGFPDQTEAVRGSPKGLLGKPHLGANQWRSTLRLPLR